MATQWLEETRKFFDEKDLRLVEWKSGGHLLRDSALTADHIVWLVRDPRLPRFSQEAMQPAANFRSIPCLAADEAHLYLRNPSTQRGQGFDTLLVHSKFVLHLSGTLFPLGPKKDGLNLMRMLGGEFKPAPQGRWTPRIAAQLNRMKRDWDVMDFRHCITPFYLRRGPTSRFDGDYIVDQTISIPVPFMEDPNDPDDGSGKYYAAAKSLGSGYSPDANGMNAIKARSNYAKLFAWSSLFGKWHGIENNPALSAKQKQIQQTTLMRAELKRTPPSPRVRTLVGLLKMITARKEKFVIVADRLFLLNLAYAVPPQTI